ncbi:MAG: hypothetical protein F6J90_03245 [Moorea sp. SIOASIH]|nr:hypothetical protein [Moorena sp. SIOASIH]
MKNAVPTPDSRLPIPDSRFPIPDSRFPTPRSAVPYSLLPTPYSLCSIMIDEPKNTTNIMLDWLAVWGMYSSGGYLAKDVISPLAKEALEDYTKDFFKESIKEYTGLSDQNIQKKLLGKALKEFMALVEEELEDADLSKQELKQYSKPLKQFIRHKSIKAILGSALKYGCVRVAWPTAKE